MLDAPALPRPSAGRSGAAWAPVRAALNRAGLRLRGPVPVVLVATALLVVPSAFDSRPAPAESFLGFEASVAGALSFAIAVIAVLDSVAHHDRRGVANVILGTAVAVVTLARITVWALGVEGRISHAEAAAGDAWLFGALDLTLGPLIAWGAARRQGRDAGWGNGVGSALARGLVIGGTMTAVAFLLLSLGADAVDRVGDALGLAGTGASLAVVAWVVHQGRRVRPGTRAALVLVGSAALAEALSRATFDPYWYASQASLLLALGCLFLGKARLLGDAMRAEFQHLWELRVLHEAAERLASTLDVVALREIVVELAVEVLSPPGSQPRRATLVRVRDGLFEVVAEHDDAGYHLVGSVFPYASFPAWHEVVERGRVRTVDLGATPLGPGARTAMARSGLRRQMVAPVVIDGRVQGLLTAGVRLPYRFSRAETAALRGIAGLAGLAFDNAWRYTDEHHLVQTLYGLAEANTDAARAEDVETVLERVTRAAMQLTRARSSAIVLLDDDGGPPHIVATDAGDRAVLERLAAELGTDGLAAAMPAGRAPAGVEEVRRDAPPQAVTALDSSGVDALLVVPLLRKDTPVGVLYVAGRDGTGRGRFAPDDEAVLVALAAHSLVAVDNVRMMRRLAEASVVDPLTGVGNRRQFEKVRAMRPRRPFTVLAIDVDNLKVVNDEAGHEAGDTVLRAVAATLAHVARAEDQVMRVGGDEFCMLVQDASLEVGREVGERVRLALQSVAVPHGQARVSIGVAAGEPGDEFDGVWTAADVHLYRAKATGRDCLVAAPTAAGPAPRWEAVVRSAFEPGGLRTVFQPIVDLAAGSVVGFEALSRPRATPPGESVEGFFSAAQRLGMMRDVDWLCRHTAFRSAASLPAGTAVFVNVSTGSLLDPVLGADKMELLVTAFGLRPGDVVLELTERELVPDLVRLADVLDQYRAAGFRFALDDVGTGRSTLGLLVVAQPEFLKIAGNIVASNGSSAADGLLDAAIVFADRTGATVIAEGIEEEPVAAQLLARGVVLGQGYGLHRPMEVEDARRLAERER